MDASTFREFSKRRNELAIQKGQVKYRTNALGARGSMIEAPQI